MRKVKAEIYNLGKKEPVTGWFHGWGTDYEEFEGGPGNYSVGIIELENGQVVRALPETITFLDRPEDV